MYATPRRFRPGWAGLTTAALCALLSACSSGSSEESLAAQQANATGTATGATAPDATGTGGTTTGTGGTTTSTAGTTTGTTGTTTSGSAGPAATAPSGSGIVRVSLTDAPSCGFSAVNVTIAAVRLNASGSAAPTDAGWIDIPVNPPQRVNLLDLRNGTLLRLGETTAPEGAYDQIRLVLAGNPPTSGVATTAPTGTGAATGASPGVTTGTTGATSTTGTTGTPTTPDTPATPVTPATPPAAGGSGTTTGTGTAGTAGATGITGITGTTGTTSTTGATGTPGAPGTPTVPAAGTTPTAATSGTTVANSVVPQGGGEVPLEAPSALASGIKVVGPGIRVTNATPAEVALDFDACRSVVTRGNGAYLLKPVVRGIPLVAAGTIVGNIDPAAASAGGATVSAQSGEGEVLRTAAVSPDGTFTLAATPAGAGLVNVVIQAPARSAAVITDVPVTAAGSGGTAGTFVTSVPTGAAPASGTPGTVAAGTTPNGTANPVTTVAGPSAGPSGTTTAGAAGTGTAAFTGSGTTTAGPPATSTAAFTGSGTTTAGPPATSTAAFTGSGTTSGTAGVTGAAGTAGTAGPSGATASTAIVTRLSTAQAPIVLPPSETRTASGIVAPLGIGATVRALGLVGAGRFETAFANVDPASGTYALTLPFAPIVIGNYNAQGQLNLVPAAPTTGGIYDLQALAAGYVTQTLPANVSTVPAVQNYTLTPETP